MSYPLSINKKTNIIFNQVTEEQIIEMFSNLLANKYGCEIEVWNTKIKIINSKNFSSATFFRDLNKGEINFIKENNKITIKAKMMLWEHLIAVCFEFIFIFLLLSQDGISPIMALKVLAVLLSVSYVFLYLFSLFAFKSFFDEIIKKINEEKV